MRFLPHEHADITTALAKERIEPSSVLFVKRRGRLHVQLPGRSDAFVFFREKSTKLDAHGRWQERVDYFIGTSKKDACDWTGVVAAFGEWLRQG